MYKKFANVTKINDIITKEKKMEGKTHAVVGAATYMAISNKLSGGFELLGLLVVILSALFSDIDHPKSLFNKYILPKKNKTAKKLVYCSLGIAILVFDYLYVKEEALGALGISLILIGVSSHRNGLTHSLTGLILFSFIIQYMEKIYKISNLNYYFFIGYISHIICDMMTKRGVPLFYPFINKKIKSPLSFTVGSKTGKRVEGIISIIALIYMLYRLPNIYG